MKRSTLERYREKQQTNERFNNLAIRFPARGIIWKKHAIPKKTTLKFDF
jgi:hypothetical protein